MEKLFEEFQNRKIQDQIITHKVYSEKILSNFSLFLINENHHLLHPLLEKENKQKIIIINAFEYLNNTFFMICFENLLVLIPDNCLKIIKKFFLLNKDSEIILLTDKGNQFFYDNNKNISRPNFDFSKEVKSFIDCFKIKKSATKILWNTILISISAYLIKIANQSTKTNRIEKVKLSSNPIKHIQITSDEYIDLRNIYTSNNSIINLIYHIEKQQLLILKQIFGDEKDKLISREKNYYLKISHPFLLKYFGSTKDNLNEALVFEYINGSSISSIPKMKLEMKNKIKIILQIMIIIDYLHYHHLIYRDLKPDNIHEYCID
ncbi:cAMP-dependent protein kinase catalytic subunit [Tritrichomonas musculus]|uniref:cAMP-dependent protein kinase catalytic subunit n=1 Tax=Tritrichomonas musculus TaxID=1915356 RepID=A0ABR2KWH6_9EUKA